jgi:hypothetical protein
MISSTSGCVASNSLAYSSIPRRTAVRSTENVFTELKHCLRVCNSLIGITARIIIHRGTALEPVGVATGNVMTIHYSSAIEQSRVRRRLLGQLLQQVRRCVSPHLHVEMLINPLNGSLRLDGRQTLPTRNRPDREHPGRDVNLFQVAAANLVNAPA